MRVRLPVLMALLALSGAVTATACGGEPDSARPGTTPPPVTGPATSPGQTPTSPGAAPDAEGVTQITVRVTGGQIEPPPGRVTVRQGSQVRLTVTSDRADEIHVHLYDIYRRVPAGGTETIQFTATMAGLAEVELEEANKQLVQLVIS